VAGSPGAPQQSGDYSSTLPGLPPDLTQVFLPVRVSSSSALASLEKNKGQRLEVVKSTLIYQPNLLTLGRVGFVDRIRRVNEEQLACFLLPPTALGAVTRWQAAEQVQLDASQLPQQAESGALFAPAPSQLSSATKLKAISSDFGDYLYRERVLSLYYSPSLDLYSQPNESEGDFRIRVQQAARERRDAEVDKMRNKYQSQLDRLQERLAKGQQQLTQDKAEYEARKREELLAAGETVVGFLGVFGRRRSTTALSRAASKRRITGNAAADVQEGESQLGRLQAQVTEMRSNMEKEATAITQTWTTAQEKIDTYPLRPARGAVRVDLTALAWVPYWEIAFNSASGSPTQERVPAWK
jgi:hypothetical protein